MKYLLTIILFIIYININAQTFKNYKEYRNFDIVMTGFELSGLSLAAYGFYKHDSMMLWSGLIFTGLTNHYKSVVIKRNLRITYSKNMVSCIYMF